MFSFGGWTGQIGVTPAFRVSVIPQNLILGQKNNKKSLTHHIAHESSSKSMSIFTCTSFYEVIPTVSFSSVNFSFLTSSIDVLVDIPSYFSVGWRSARNLQSCWITRDQGSVGDDCGDHTRRREAWELWVYCYTPETFSYGVRREQWNRYNSKPPVVT